MPLQPVRGEPGEPWLIGKSGWILGMSAWADTSLYVVVDFLQMHGTRRLRASDRSNLGRWIRRSRRCRHRCSSLAEKNEDIATNKCWRWRMLQFHCILPWGAAVEKMYIFHLTGYTSDHPVCYTLPVVRDDHCVTFFLQCPMRARPHAQKEISDGSQRLPQRT